MWRILTTVLIVLTFECTVSASVETSLYRKKSELITVMVIDTGIDANHPLLSKHVTSDGSDDYQFDHGHGTHVAGIILYGNRMKPGMSGKPRNQDPVCKEVRIISCRFYRRKNSGDQNLVSSIQCVKKATELKVDYINYSGGGLLKSHIELEAFREYSKTGGTVFAAAGNEDMSLLKGAYYPASYGLNDRVPRIYTVENVTADGDLVKSSNSHPDALREVGSNVYSTLPNDSYGAMTGTSQAAPAALHFVLKQRCFDLSQKR